MSENDLDFDFEEGIFGDADVNVSDIPDDQFDFGNAHWPIRIIGLGDVKVTKNGDKLGMMIKWAVEHPKYDGHYVGKQLGNGNWQQLPIPKPLQPRIPWDPKNNPDHKKVLVDLRDLYEALGFSKDQMKYIKPKDLIGKMCAAKIRPVKTPEGFWGFNLFGMKPYDPTSDGANEFAQSSSDNSSAVDAEELLRREMGEA